MELPYFSGYLESTTGGGLYYSMKFKLVFNIVLTVFLIVFYFISPIHANNTTKQEESYFLTSMAFTEEIKIGGVDMLYINEDSFIPPIGFGFYLGSNKEDNIEIRGEVMDGTIPHDNYTTVGWKYMSPVIWTISFPYKINENLLLNSGAGIMVQHARKYVRSSATGYYYVHDRKNKYESEFRASIIFTRSSFFEPFIAGIGYSKIGGINVSLGVSF